MDSSEVLNLYNGCVGINITNQPANQNLLKGKNAMFVVSSSYAGASYQWQTDKGTGFVNLSNAGQYNGATNDTLIISGVSSSNDGQKFRCIASSGSVCKDTSKIATLTVCPAITTQPSNQSVTEGRSATFIAASADVNATYQWQTDQGTGYANLSNAGQYSGAKNDTLTVSNTTLSNNNQNFRCIVKSGSSCIDTTTIAVLDVSVKNGINENHNNVGFALYPNPANNRINVKSDVSLVGSAYSITDVVGKVVMSGKLSAVNSIISIENLPNGEYIFKLGNKSNQSFKIIKE